MSKVSSDKFNVDVSLEGVHSPDYIWKLTREHDGLMRTSYEVTWIEWNADGTFKQRNDGPIIGSSLLMSPFNHFFTWQTTMIEEIIHTELVDDKLVAVKFKTTNSTYQLKRIANPEIQNESEI